MDIWFILDQQQKVFKGTVVNWTFHSIHEKSIFQNSLRGNKPGGKDKHPESPESVSTSYLAWVYQICLKMK